MSVATQESNSSTHHACSIYTRRPIHQVRLVFLYLSQIVHDCLDLPTATPLTSIYASQLGSEVDHGLSDPNQDLFISSLRFFNRCLGRQVFMLHVYPEATSRQRYKHRSLLVDPVRPGPVWPETFIHFYSPSENHALGCGLVCTPLRIPHSGYRPRPRPPRP